MVKQSAVAEKLLQLLVDTLLRDEVIFRQFTVHELLWGK